MSLRWLLCVCVMLVCSATTAANVEVKGLFAGSALLVINGENKLLKAGRTYQGVTLISADSRKAVVSVDGKQYSLGMSKHIASSFQPAQTREVRLQPGRGGHYMTPARINNLPVSVMVDTGATSVAMSLPQAKALGIDYRNGELISISTANGYANAYKVMLSRVTVGTVSVENVEAIVSMSNFPEQILLGNSYLNRVKMFTENGVLVFQSQY
ncbi:TIGR02281 family clan AA aspartic protease [Aestuariicella sp. G3-2]|uniref:retropepsin-like aspartic protease family protein n=1 Tax=Pseudomaricurvus albidus TaxID=2842452 RepID=UPI001C0E88CE|nr:TIGR02281 family clan AA aspartic protease [Aestuariicella albida]MBU3069443.1 TIGR02281 family clan AA aspartic protease [Aestuariicella albida]